MTWLPPAIAPIVLLLISNVFMMLTPDEARQRARNGPTRTISSGRLFFTLPTWLWGTTRPQL